MINLVLIEDHELVRSGFRQILETDANIQVVGESGSGVEGIQLVRTLKPDIVLLDVYLPDISGLEVTRRLLAREKSIKIMIVSGAGHDSFPFKLLDAGALSYLTKNTPQEEFIRAVKATYAGKSYISQTVSSHIVLSQLGFRSQKKHPNLSNRQLEVLLMLMRDIPVEEIAQKLHMSIKTVHSNRYRMWEKFNVKSDIGVMTIAIKKGIVTLVDIEQST
ncbi:MAG: response regulator [Proteobacteria bacterium]|nr:response regulator [Pseudomonadota bacterium]